MRLGFIFCAVHQWLRNQDHEFYHTGIHALVIRWIKTVEKDGDYIEKSFGRFLDGGLIANNPTLDALTEIHEYNLALKAVGRSAEVRPVTVLKEIDVFRPESLWDTARLAIGISALGTLLVDQATASDGRVVDRARAWCSMIGVPYFRFTPQMSEDIAMDEKSDEKLVNMLWEAKAHIHANYTMVREVAELLNME
ncbi:hypothetical protein C0J52_04240 [Blattella germanica]|nr:hypothetical protein C0J52_04240 [Blattella germanica]